MMIKFASWNLCLGIKNKKDYVYDTIRREKIDICLLQEVEIKKDYPAELLSSSDYKIEIEKYNKAGVHRSFKLLGKAAIMNYHQKIIFKFNKDKQIKVINL